MKLTIYYAIIHICQWDDALEQNIRTSPDKCSKKGEVKHKKRLQTLNSENVAKKDVSGKDNKTTGISIVLNWNFFMRKDRIIGERKRGMDANEKQLRMFMDWSNHWIKADVFEHFCMNKITSAKRVRQKD